MPITAEITCQNRGVPRIWQGGQEFFFRFARGVWGHAPPPENFFKRVRFGVYFDQILSLKNFKNYHFLYKNFENCNFLYKRINILDIHDCYGVTIRLKNFCEKFMIDAFWYVF